MNNIVLNQLDHIRAALRLRPDDPMLRVQEGFALRALGRVSEAKASVDKAYRSARGDMSVLDAVAVFHSGLGAYDEALRIYDAMLRQDSGHAPALFNRAVVKRFLGDLAGAEEDYDHAIRIRPDDWEAYHNRSELRIQSEGRNHVAELEAALARPIADWRGRVQLLFALHKEYEDLGEHDRAWSRLCEGAALRRANMRYDIRNDLDTVTWIEQTHRAPPDRRPDGGIGGPIFILGMPRSGSTMIDRIVSFHPDVRSGGELDHFALAMVNAVRQRSRNATVSRQDMVRLSAELDFSALGADYIARSRHEAGDSPRFTDKMPLNYLYCGLIWRALPGASIIHSVRHPMAVCHSMFKTLFKKGYPFSYDLEETGRYYVGYRRLMAHWATIAPDRIQDVAYEDMIERPEPVMRRTFAACDLAWRPEYLEFHKNPQPTSTASAAQVRRPLYKSGGDLWRRYEKHLGPLRRILDEAGLATD